MDKWISAENKPDIDEEVLGAMWRPDEYDFIYWLVGWNGKYWYEFQNPELELEANCEPCKILYWMNTPDAPMEPDD